MSRHFVWHEAFSAEQIPPFGRNDGALRSVLILASLCGPTGGTKRSEIARFLCRARIGDPANGGYPPRSLSHGGLMGLRLSDSHSPYACDFFFGSQSSACEVSDRSSISRSFFASWQSGSSQRFTSSSGSFVRSNSRPLPRLA